MGRVGRIRAIVIACCVALLEIACRLGIVKPVTLIPPSEMVSELSRLLISGSLTAPIAKTLSNVAIAFSLAVLVGFVAGLLVHAMPRLRRALDPFFATYYAVPFFVFYPVFIVIFGLNDLPIITIAFLFAVVVMILSTLNGLDRVPPVFLKVSRVCAMSSLATAALVRLPSATPQLFTGVKLAVAYSFIGVIASEFILSDSGVGYAIAYAYNNLNNRHMYALMLLIVLIVTSINSILYAWEQRIMRRRGGR